MRQIRTILRPVCAILGLKILVAYLDPGSGSLLAQLLVAALAAPGKLCENEPTMLYHCVPCALCTWLSQD